MSPSLSSTFMRAVVEIAAQQYTVEPGQILVVPHLPTEPGSIVEFSHLLLVEAGPTALVGTPYVEGCVRAEVLEHGKGEKVIVFKKKRRKGYKRFKGHRQLYTRLRITSIELRGSSTTETV
jgi:large subunit ribosomal protein L21